MCHVFITHLYFIPQRPHKSAVIKKQSHRQEALQLPFKHGFQQFTTQDDLFLQFTLCTYTNILKHTNTGVSRLISVFPLLLSLNHPRESKDHTEWASKRCVRLSIYFYIAVKKRYFNTLICRRTDTEPNYFCVYTDHVLGFVPDVTEEDCTDMEHLRKLNISAGI